MTYIVKRISQFKKSYKLAVRRGLDVSLLEDVINKLKDGITLEEKFHDHQLAGNMKLFRYCLLDDFCPSETLALLKKLDLFLMREIPSFCASNEA